MIPTDSALSTPQDFLRYRGVLLSAPADMRRYERAVEPAADFEPLQCLFGHDAQLHAFASALCRVGVKPWFLPAPDLYASPYALTRLLNSLGENMEGPNRLAHVCFGLPWMARVLKGAKNLAVLAGIADEAPLHFGYHPFGSGNKLPAAFTGILAYDELQAPVRTSDGRDLPTGRLNEAFTDAQRLHLGAEEQTGHINENRLQAEFRIQSVLEFTTAGWEETIADGAAASLDFRRALIRRNVVLPGQKGPLRFSLLPWNMANGRSLVPDIALRLASDKERSEYEHGIILLPYNEDQTSLVRLQSLVEQCRAGASPGCAETIFLMRVVSMRSIPALRSIVTNCWLDGSDPEWRWNARRLAMMKFHGVLLLGSASENSCETSPAPSGVEAIIPAEDSRVVRSDDSFGERFWRVNTLSTRGLRKLLQYTRGTDSAKVRS